MLIPSGHYSGKYVISKSGLSIEIYAMQGLNVLSSVLVHSYTIHLCEQSCKSMYLHWFELFSKPQH